MASYPNCSCNVLKKDQLKEFTARYEFSCSSRQISIVPGNGRLRSNDLVLVNIIFEPKLSKYAVTKRTKELKAAKIAEESERLDLEAKVEKRSSKKEKSLGNLLLSFFFFLLFFCILLYDDYHTFQ